MIEHSFFGIAAGIIGLVAFIPYILGTLSGRTKPNKATWIIWAVLGVIIAASYWSAGARDTAWTPIGFAIGIVVVTALVFKHGEDGWTTLDIACLVGAGIGLALWAITKDPTTALYLSTAVDAIGSIPTIKKAWKRPESEKNAAWPMFFLSNTLNLFAIGEWTLTIALYPVYVFILSGTMTLLIIRKRSGVRRRRPGHQASSV